MTNAIAQRLARVRAEIDGACRRAGRAPDDVTLVAVSKRKPESDVALALTAGHRDFGENYAQELRDKSRRLADHAGPADAGPRWHFIGPLQQNKVKYVVGTAVLVHTVDSMRILEAIERRAAGQGLFQDVLVQVNLAQEAQKAGTSEADLEALLEGFSRTPHVLCRGLMIMPPWDPDPEAARPLFRRLSRLRDAIAQRRLPGVRPDHLSMGMSHDFGVAIEEGATLVRVGTAIFGERD